MGSSQSSLAKNAKSSVKGKRTIKGKGGRKSLESPQPAMMASIVSIPSELLKIPELEDTTGRSTDKLEQSVEIILEAESESTLETDSDDDEDEDWNEERRSILEDARKLKEFAQFYLHPEKPVVSEGGARCFFDRLSAPQPMATDESAEKVAILADAKALKALAQDYLHPERPVVATDPFACARNFYSRPSATEQESTEDAEERSRILDDARALKKLAGDYMHPERPVETTDPFACGRNFFSRPSGVDQSTAEEDQEHSRILEDAQALKQLAVDYLHPELPVETSDPTVFGRNFFSRSSAPNQESPEESKERARILADAMALKQLAVDYAHPELPVVTTDPAAFARNFFSRPSAPAQEPFGEIDERDRILEDAKALKQLAVDYLHPEVPVTTTDAFAFGRNYFSRPSAPMQESVDEAIERGQVYLDAQALKQLATDYMHPEFPVQTSDSTSFGRNYFSRPSAPSQESAEEADERARVLEDAKALKKLAVDYLHPELPVSTTDPTACGRNYFNRPSAALHDQMIHTFPPHEHDEVHHHFDEHIDHFGMDEDISMFQDMREKLTSVMPEDNLNKSDEVGSNLSRSPSSVMLFQEDMTSP